MRRAALAVQQFQTSAGTAGAAVAAISFGAFTTAAVVATREANAFEKAIAEIATLLPGATLEIERLSTNVRKLAKEFGIGVGQQAAAAYQIISAGARNAAEANFILEKSNTLAVGGLTSIAVAADGLTSILNAYGPSAVNAGQATDAMFVAMKYGKTTIDELSRSVGLVAPIAAEAGVSLDELLSSVSALTKGGIRTRLAFTGMRQIISSIIKPTTEARYAANQLGIEFNALSLYEKGLVGFFDMLKEGTGGSTESLAMLFGGVEALVPILALVGRQSENFAMILEEQASKAGAAAEALKTMEQTGAFAFDRLKTASTDVLLDFGDQVRTLLIPAARALTNVLDNASTGAKALKGAIQLLGGVITLLALSWFPLVAKVAVPAYVRAMFAATVATGSFSGAITLLGAKLVAAMATPMGAYIAALGIVLGILAKITIENYKLEKELQRTQQLTNQFINDLAKLDYTLNVDITENYLTKLRDQWKEAAEESQTQVNKIQTQIDNLEGTRVDLSDVWVSMEDAERNAISITQRKVELEKELAIAQAKNDQARARFAATEEMLTNIAAQRQLQDIKDTAQRQVLRLEEERAIQELARERARLEQQLADWINNLTATSVDKQMAQLDRLRTGWLEAFGEIDTAARQSFDRILDAITMEGALEDIQQAAKEVSRIDLRLAPGTDVVGVYESLIGHLEVMLSHLEEGTVLFNQVNDLIYQMRTQIDRVAMENIVAGPKADFSRAIRDINNRMQRGIISPSEWTRLASEAHEALVQGLEQSVQNRGVGTYGDEIADEIRKILASTDFIVDFEVKYDDAIAEARIALAKGLGDREIYAEAERVAAEAFNRIVLGIIDTTQDPGLKRALAAMLKMETAIDSKNFRKMALEIERAGRAALQMLNAFELISQRTEDIIEGMIQIAANLPGAISGDLNSIAQIIAGAAQAMKAMLGDSEEDKKRREALRHNTTALRNLHQGILDLSGVQQISGRSITGAIKAFQDNLEGVMKIIQDETGLVEYATFQQTLDALEINLRKFGLTMSDLENIASTLGWALEDGKENFEEFLEFLLSLKIGEVFADAASQIDLLKRRIELFDLEPFDELDLLRKQFLELTKLDPAMQFALATADLTTSIGRATFIDLLKQIFEQFPDLTFEQLGDLTPQQFLDFIMEMKRVTDSAEEFADNMNALNRSLKNVPDGFKVALARFEATAAIEAKKAADVIRPKVPKIEPPKPEDDIPAIPDSTRRAIRALDAFSESLNSLDIVNFDTNLSLASLELINFANILSRIEIPQIQMPEVQNESYRAPMPPEVHQTLILSVEPGAITITGVDDPEKAAELALEGLKVKAKSFYGNTTEWYKL